ncbi:cuticle protein [Culex quinquefasciatus]|uniref:Cuticle protein n=1 Tax=Culex quinquefasciatus TaxID=7176 RepID=B0W8B8_CULQU|nr:cuticle protein [Culex quinquefasciatus]|eukprot:XP_001844952.1 cuticle protein [Culex quinquefasciatus]
MAFKMVVLFAALATASAGYIEADHHQHYSPASAVSYSSITREHHAPKLAVAKTLSYAEPQVHYAAPAIQYAAPVHKEYAVHEHQPLLKTVVAQPAYTKTIVQQPTYAKTLISEPTYAHAAPVYAHAAPVYAHAAKTISYSAPIVKNVEYSKTLAYTAPVAKTSIFRSARRGIQTSNLWIVSLVRGPIDPHGWDQACKKFPTQRTHEANQNVSSLLACDCKPTVSVQPLPPDSCRSAAGE